MDDALTKALSNFFKTCDALIDETNKMVGFYRLAQTLPEAKKIQKIQELEAENTKLKQTFVENLTGLNITITELKNKIKSLEVGIKGLTAKLDAEEKEEA